MNQDHSTEDQALPRSFQPLVEIAVRYAGAEGCAIYQLNPNNGLQELRWSSGITALESEPGVLATDSYPLDVGETVQGLLTFLFREEARGENNAGPVLERIARAIESVWRLSLIPDTYARQAAHVGQLEAELADEKIAERARGMLSDTVSPRQGVDTILRHVETVIRPGQLAAALVQITSEVEHQVAERALASRAKSVLQRRYGMSEEQAHVHLRMASRKSRRRMSEVALDVLKESHL